MGKKQVTEVANAFSRMNFLYQAAVLVSKLAPHTLLASYYSRLMKEVSKKVVEKIHPEIKRSVCACCSFPLFTTVDHAHVSIKGHKKKQKKKKTLTKALNTKKVTSHFKTDNVKDSTANYSLIQKFKKNFKPNRLVWNCEKCGFSRTFLQRPSHTLWTDTFNIDII